MVRDWYIKKGWHKMTYLATCPQLEIYSSQDLLLTYCVNSKKKKICDPNPWIMPGARTYKQLFDLGT